MCASGVHTDICCTVFTHLVHEPLMGFNVKRLNLKASYSTLYKYSVYKVPALATLTQGIV